MIIINEDYLVYTNHIQPGRDSTQLWSHVLWLQ